MSGIEALYAQLKPDMEAIADPLFQLSEESIAEEGDFLPHGAAMNDDGEVVLVEAESEDGADLTTPEAVLPVLHRALRSATKERGVRAIGVAESVTIEPHGGPRTRAIKVLFEHKRGLTLAVYLPFKLGPKGKMTFQEILIMPAEPEVSPWGKVSRK